MKKMKMLFLAILLIGVAGGALAFKTKKFNDLLYFGCGVDKKCDNAATLTLSRASTNQTDPVAMGILTSSTITCSTNSDCGSFHYTVDF